MSTPTRPPIVGAIWAMSAMLFFSVNDVTIKFLSPYYALHEIVLLRSLIGMAVLLAFIVPFSGGLAALRTNRLGLHLIRASFVVVANMAFFLGLSAMPIAEAVAIFFISPLVITVFSVIFLKETVGPRRWVAIAVGLCGVIVMVRPGTEAFQPASLLPLAAAVCYASLHMMTRKLGGTEGAAALSFYIQITFVVVTLAIGLAIGDGRYSEQDNVSLAFFFRAWSWPAAEHWPLLCAVGATSALGGFFISQAYRLTEAAFIAPFEYVAMPIAIFWGVVVFDEWPDAVAWAGIALIIGSGLYLLWRETVVGRSHAASGSEYRR